jgi:transposase
MWEALGSPTTGAWTWSSGDWTSAPPARMSRCPGRCGLATRMERRQGCGRGRQACRFSTGAIRVEADRHHVTLPRLGCLKTHESTRKLARRLEQGTARILGATISQQGDRWFVSFTCQVQRAQRRPRRPSGSIGVDVGIRHLAVLSSGKLVSNPRPLAAELRRLRRVSRQLARQQGPRAPAGTLRPPSKGWRRTQQRLARHHGRVANLRAEAPHQLTTGLAAGYGTVVVERLNCPACGLVVDRDLNAARNLAALVDGIQQIEQVVAGSGPETIQNACVRDSQPTGDGGRSGSPDIGREAAGSQQLFPV